MSAGGFRFLLYPPYAFAPSPSTGEGWGEGDSYSIFFVSGWTCDCTRTGKPQIWMKPREALWSN